MAIEYIKKAAKTSATGEDNTRDIVVKMLKRNRSGWRRRKRWNTPGSWTAGMVATRL